MGEGGEEAGREGGGGGTVLLRRSVKRSWMLLCLFAWPWGGSRGVTEGEVGGAAVVVVVVVVVEMCV